MPLYSLRKLKDSEISQGLSLLRANLHWLEKQGIHQWSANLIERDYPKYQKRGENFAFQYEDQIVAVLSLHTSAPSYWLAALKCRNYRFLSKLAVDLRHRGRGFGKQAVLAVQQLSRDEKVEGLFLEVSHEEGFLVQYYKKLGFAVVDRIEVELESGMYDMVLMKCSLGQ